MVFYAEIYTAKLHLVLLYPGVQHGIWPEVIVNSENLT